MNLGIFWRLKDLISPAVQQVVRSARYAQDVMARANQSMQRGWRDSGETINSLRKKIQDLETSRNAMRIGVDTRQIQAANVQIDRLNRQLDNLEGRGRRAEGRGGWLGGLLPKGLGVGLGLMGAVGVAQGALNKGMEREAVEAQFKYFVGNAEVAQNLIKQLKQYGDKYTMYNKGDLLSSGAALAETFGSGEVMKMTNIIGALAKGKSENFMGIMTRLQQVKGTGYLQQDELLELQTRGVYGIQEQIIKNKNITLAQFNKLKEAQKISYGDVEQALLDMTSQGGKYGGFLDEAMKQTKTKWDSIKNIVDEKMTNIGEMTSGKLNDLLDWFHKFLQSTKPIEDAMSRLGNAFRPVFLAIRDLLVHLGLINPAGDSVQQVVSLLTNVINVMTTAVQWAGGMLQWLVSVFQAIPFSKYIAGFLAINWALKSIGVFTLINSLTSLTGVFGLVQKAWLALKTAFVFSQVGLIVTAVVALAAALYYAWNESAKFREVLYGMWGGVQEIWLRITEIWNSVASFFKAVSEVLTAIGLVIGQVWNKIMNWIREQWSKLIEWFKTTQFGSWIFETIDKIGKAWSGMMENIKKWWDGAKEYLIIGFRVLMAYYTLGLSELGIAIYKQFNQGYQKGVNSFNQQKIDTNAKLALDKANKHRIELVEAQRLKFNSMPPKSPTVPTMPSGVGAGSGSGSGGGITDTVEGAKSKSITINLNKGLIETSNIIVDNKGTGLDIERQVVEALRRITMSGERLALE